MLFECPDLYHIYTVTYNEDTCNSVSLKIHVLSLESLLLNYRDLFQYLLI